MTKGEQQVWIGLLQVKQRPGTGTLLDRNLAFVNAVAPAIDERDFRRSVAQALDGMGFDLMDVEDVETVEERQRQHQIDPELLRSAAEAKARQTPQFGTFHTWTSED